MSRRHRVVILEAAEADIRELRNYMLKNFGTASWQDTYAGLKQAIRHLAAFPLLGSIPDELASLHLIQYRQVISGMNRIVYETRGERVYVHLVADTRRDLKSLLTRRLLRGA